MTIHGEHPFATPDAERDPVRRLRGRLGTTVSLWTSGADADRAGLTVSSYLVAAGEPGHVVALLDPDSELFSRLDTTGTVVLQLLEWEHRMLADAFASQLPAPGGAWRLAGWTQTAWGPLLDTASGWAGLRLVGRSREVGWSMLVDCVVERVVLGESPAPLVHRRGRYVRPATGRT